MNDRHNWENLKLSSTSTSPDNFTNELFCMALRKAHNEDLPWIMWTKLWSWQVVGAVVLFAWAGGIAFMLSSLFVVADIFYILGALLLFLKFVTWEDHTGKPRKEIIRNSLVAIASIVLLLAVAFWGNHHLKNKLEVSIKKTDVPTPTAAAALSESSTPKNDLYAKKDLPPKANGTHKATRTSTSIKQPPSAQINAPNGIAIGGNNLGTATVNNYGPLPLVLTPAQQAQLAASLDIFKGESAELDVDNATQETDAFASALMHSLTEAKMNVKRKDAMFIGGCLRYPGVSFMVGVNRTKTAEAIWRALVSVGAVKGKGQGCSRSGEPDELVINIRPN